MRIALYSNSTKINSGGGIVYLLSIAEILSKKNSVTVYFNFDEKFDLLKTNYSKNIQFKKKGIIRIPIIGQLLFAINEYLMFDIVIQQSLYAPRLTFVKQSFILCDFPFGEIKSLSERFRLRFWNNIIVNSNYTKKNLKMKWKRDSIVLYPPIKVKKEIKIKKRNLIVSIGRIVDNKRSKRQDVIIDVFKRLIDYGYDDYELVLLGFVEDYSYLNKIKKSIKNYPIKIIENCNQERKNEFLDKAKFYISACGYMVDAYKYPERVEHYGISVVEAMACGCIPFAVDKGGHRETIKHMENGALWETKQELLNSLINIINDKNKYEKLSKNVFKDSKKFSYKQLEFNLESILK